MERNELRGLSLPSLQEEPEQTYLMEDEDGFLVSVPESRLDARTEKQGSGSLPDNVKQRLIDGLMQRIYGA